MNIEFKKFDTKSQIKEHEALFEDCFPEVYNKEDYRKNYEAVFMHLYHSFPSVPSSYQYSAMLDGELIGYFAALPYRYKIGSKFITSGMVGGVMISPKYRKMGLFTQLGKYAAEEQKKSGISLNFGYPIRKATAPGLTRMGWETGFELPLFIKFLKITSLLKTKKLHLLAFILNPFIDLYHLLLRKEGGEDYQIKVYDSITKVEGYQAFFGEWISNSSNALLKDIQFLNWRYGTPGKKYLFFCAYQRDSLKGLLCARAIVREGVPSYGILDFMTIDEKCISDLHKAIHHRAQIDKKEAIMVMMSNYSAKTYRLYRYGFLKSPFRFKMMMNILSDDLLKEELLNEKLWHLMFVDSDDL